RSGCTSARGCAPSAVSTTGSWSRRLDGGSQRAEAPALPVPERESGTVSALRARCPDCRTLTAVAIGPEYQCHSCGREFAAGLVRVPRAWGDGGESMAEAAHMSAPWPEAATIDEETLEDQVAAMGRQLPARPLVLGGCCCSHVGAVRELARHGRI